jgi:hypothetical protein
MFLLLVVLYDILKKRADIDIRSWTVLWRASERRAKLPRDLLMNQEGE